MNNNPSIPLHTSNRVRKAMEDLKYNADTNSQKRRRHANAETYRIGVVADMPLAWWRSPSYVDTMHAIEQEVRTSGSTLLFVHSSDEKEQNRIYGSVDGVILFGVQKSRAEIGQISHLPNVAIYNIGPDEMWCDCVRVDDEKAGELAAKCLIAQDIRNVCMLTRIPTIEKDFRREGFQKTILANGGNILPLDIEESVKIRNDEQYADREIVSRQIDALLAQNPRPNGLFLPCDILAPTVYFVLMERGIKPGADIAIISCNNEQAYLKPLHPTPISIDIHPREVGRSAVERLLWRIENPSAPLSTICILPSVPDSQAHS